MHPIQEKLLGLSKRENLAKLSLREMAARIGLPEGFVAGVQALAWLTPKPPAG